MGLWDGIRRLWRGSGQGTVVRAPAGPLSTRGDTEAQISLLLSEVSAGGREQKQLLPQDVLPMGWSDRPMWSSWSTAGAIQYGFKAISWVYVCVHKTALAISSLPLVVERQGGDGAWSRDTKSPLQALLDRPNAFWTTQALVYRIVSELLLGGNSLVSKVRVGEVPVELFTVRPHRIAPVPSRTDFIREYRVMGADGREYSVPAEDVVHIQLPDPDSPYWGMSPMQAAARVVDIENDAQNWQKVGLQNLMVPPGIIQLLGHFSLDDWNREHAKLKDAYQGALNARKPMIVGREVKWQQLSLTPAEVDFIETRKLSREEVCAVYGMPPPIAGILDRATYNNINTANRMWWEHTLVPLSQFISGGLTLGLASEFDPAQRIIPDTSKVVALLGAVLERVNAVKDLFGMGVPFNLASEFVQLGLTYPGGDVSYLPQNLVPSEAQLHPVDPDDAKGWAASYYGRAEGHRGEPQELVGDEGPAEVSKELDAVIGRFLGRLNGGADGTH